MPTSEEANAGRPDRAEDKAPAPARKSDRLVQVLLIDPRPFDRACTLAGLKENGSLAVDAIDDLDMAYEGPPPDVLLLQEDASGRPRHTLPEQITRARRRWTHSLPIVISREGDDDRLMESLQAGVSGVLTSDAHPRVWVQSIKLIMSGKAVYPQSMVELLRAALGRNRQANAGSGSPNGLDDKFSQLTPRQHEVLRLLAIGLPNHKIASLLRISVSTVKVHVRAIMMQVGVENRTQIVAQYVGKLPA